MKSSSEMSEGTFAHVETCTGQLAVANWQKTKEVNDFIRFPLVKLPCDFD